MGRCREVNDIIAPEFNRLKELGKMGAILLNDMWHIAVTHVGCVSSGILWVKFKFSTPR